MEYNEKVTVLVTTSCLEVYKLLGDSLPQRVLVQLEPLANPITIATFLRKWQPQIGVFLDTPFQRELALMARESGVSLALLNAHMPGEEMLEWHAHRTSREMLKQMLSSYSLIVPRTYVDVGRFRMLGATLGQMPGWSTDLQQASELGACATRLLSQRPKIRRSLLKRLGQRQLWVAANTLPGEEAVVARVHAALRRQHKGLLTLVAPRVTQPAGGRADGGNGLDAYVAAARRLSADRRLQVELLSAAMRAPERLSADVDVLVLDDADALTTLYSLSEIVLVGGSLLPSLEGACSPAAAAVAGCALLMGPHGAEFLGMASDLNHAAVMASEEVAAAVAQTGAAMRGIHPGGFDTPRESRDHGRNATPGAGPWPDRPATGATAPAAMGLGGGAEAHAAADGGAPGSTGPSWQQLVTEAQQPVRTFRPMSAPPTVPEHFQLRPDLEGYALSPFGAVSLESSLQLGSSGPGGFFIAPLSTPGATRSFGAASLASRPCLADGPASAEFATPASAAATAVRTGDAQSRRRAIDRFRWASSREVIGFGYTVESGDESLGSASSTCDSEDDQRDGEAQTSTAPKPSERGPRSASSGTEHAVSVGPTTSDTAASAAAVVPPLPPASPRRTGGSSSASFPDSTSVFGSNAQDACTDGPVAAVRGGADCGDSSAEAVSDDDDFHDAVEAEVAEEDLPQTSPVAPAPRASVSVLAPASIADGDGVEVTVERLTAAKSAPAKPEPSGLQTEAPATQGTLSEASASVEASNTVGACMMEPVAPLADDAGAGAADQGASVLEGAELTSTAVTGDMTVVEAEAEAEPVDKQAAAADVHQVEAEAPPSLGQAPPASRRPQIWIADHPARPNRSAGGCSDGNGDSCRPAGTSGDGGSLSSYEELPTLRGTHQGHLIICRDGDVQAEDETASWASPRLGFRAARHPTVSDPGLSPASSQPRWEDFAAGPRGLDFQWPPAVTGASRSEDGMDLAPAIDGTAAATTSPVSDGPCGRRPSHEIARATPVPAEMLHRSLGALDESALCETFASDVSMAALMEDSPNEEREDAMLPPGAPSPPSIATAAREASGVWAEGSQPNFSRDSLDHYLAGINQQAMMTTTSGYSRGRAARGPAAMTRLSGRAPLAVDSIVNLVGLADMADAAEEKDDADTAAAGEEGGDAPAAGGVSSGSGGSSSDGQDGGPMLPLPPSVDTEVVKEAGEGSGEPSPTVVSAANALPGVQEMPDEALTGSSPTSVATLAGGSSARESSAAAAAAAPAGFARGGGGRGATADGHTPCTAESPKSDFEFGGSVPDDAGSGSPTLLATASIHNGSGANLQAYVAADGSEAGSQQPETLAPLAAPAQATLALRPNSRTSSPSSTHSWSDAPATSSPPPPPVLPLTQPAASRYMASRQQSPSQPSARSSASSNPYELGSCFAGQTSFKWLPDGAFASAAAAAAVATPASAAPSSPRTRSPASESGGAGAGSPAEFPAVPQQPSGWAAARGTSLSSAASAASIGSRNSSGFYQVASIGSWLDHFGSMLPQPSLGLQRSQAQHDPMVWFSQQLASHREAGCGCGSGSAAPAAAALHGVAPGLRAPMHSPLGALDEDRYLGINPQALASVSTTLFPTAHAAVSYRAPMPLHAGAIPASPRAAQSRLATATAAPSSPLRSSSSISSAQVTAAFTMGKSQHSSGGVGSSVSLQTYPLHAGPAGPAATATSPVHAPDAAAAVAASAAPHTARDELSVLLNSPRSPVSPVRVSRVVSPAMERRAAAAVGPMASPARPFPATGLPPPRSPAAGYASPPPPSPSRWSHAREGSGTAAPDSPETEAWPLPMAPLPSINTPRRELQRRLSAPVRRASPPSWPPPLQNTHSVVPGAVPIWRLEGGAVEQVAAGAVNSTRAPVLPLMPSPGGRATTAAAAGPGAAVVDGLLLLRRPDSPHTSDSSSCPNTPTSRAADTATSPFRGPKGAALRSPIAQLPPPVKGLSMDGQVDDKFEASFEAAVRAGPARSPARSVVGGAGSVHVSPYSSPYRSPFAAMMASSVTAATAAAAAAAAGSCSPRPGPAFRSLFLEEEEEELAAQALGEGEPEAEEDQMPLSPRASSHNVLFSMQEPREDEMPSAAALGLSRNAVFSGLTRGAVPGPVFKSPPPARPQLHPLLPPAASATAALPSVFALASHLSPPARCQRLPPGALGSGATGAVPAATAVMPPAATVVPAFGSRLDIPDSQRTSPIEPDPLGFSTDEPISPSSGIALLPDVSALRPNSATAAAMAAAASMAAAAAAAASGGRGGVSALRSVLDSAPTFSRIPSLTVSSDSEEGDGSAAASPAARHFPHLSDGAASRQPRITLSGGPLVVPEVAEGAMGGGSHPLPKSHLSQASGPRREDEEDEEESDLEEEASMELPPPLSYMAANTDGASGAADETPRHIPQGPARSGEGSPRASCSSLASMSNNNNLASGADESGSVAGSVGGGAGGAGLRYSMAGSGGTACHGSAGSLASAAAATAAADRGESPPRSPAERTRCPRSSCPSASPIKQRLHSAQSSPVPRSFLIDATGSPPLPYTTTTQLHSGGGRWPMPQSPSSPPLRSPQAGTSLAAAAAQADPLSPPATYMSPRAADPRASPIKVMTAMKRTPADVPGPAADGGAPRLLHPPSPNGGGGAATAPFSSNAASSMAYAILGPSAVGGGVISLNDRLPAGGVAPIFSGMAPLRTQAAPGGASASPAGVPAAAGSPLPAASPRHRGAAAAPWQPWPTAYAAGGDGAGDDDDEPLLATRASAPADFTALSGRGLPPTPRSGRRDTNPLLGPFGGATGGRSNSISQAHDLHAQRNQQQQAWDRARAESRTASAAGTPRSARALFAGGGSLQLPAPFSSASGGGVFMTDVCVSPVEAPRSPRVGMSPVRPPVFALDAAAAVAGGPASAEEESWLQQQDQLLRQAASGQGGTPRSARVLFPPASPRQQQQQQGAAAAEPPSPSWSHVSRRLFPEGGAAAAAAASPAGTATPERRPVDELDEFLANMTVQVASPVSPQPRLPPPASPRLLSPGAAASAAAGSSASRGAGRRSAAPSRHPSSPLLQTARKTSASGEQQQQQDTLLRLSSQRIVPSPGPGPARDASSTIQPLHGGTVTFRSPGAPPAQPLWGQGLTGNAGAGGSRNSSSGAGGQRPQAMPALPPLPPLPPLRGQVSGLPSVISPVSPRLAGSAAGALPMGWPFPAQPAGAGDAAPFGLAYTAPGGGGSSSGARDTAAYPNAASSVDMVRRLLFRQSAPELSHAVPNMQMPVPAGPTAGVPVVGVSAPAPAVVPSPPAAAGSIPLPSVPSTAEQAALVALESQFKAAEQEAADLPIETRVVTPTSLPPASNTTATTSSYSFRPSMGNDGLASGLLAGSGFAMGDGAALAAAASAAAQGGGRPSTAPDRQVAPPSPRAPAAGVASFALGPGGAQPSGGLGPGGGSRAGSAGTRGDGGGSGVDRLEVKPAAAAPSVPAAAGGAGGAQMGSNAASVAAQAHGQAGAGSCSSTDAGFKQTAATGAVATAAAGAAEPVGPIMRPVSGPFAASAAADAAGGSEQRPQELSRAAGTGGSRQHAGPRHSAAPASGAAQRSARAYGLAAAGATPPQSRNARTRGAAVRAGSIDSPPGSIGGAPGAEPFIAPCARYAGQFLIPAAQITSDPRMGPAVWLVSNEDELAAALSRLLFDSIERQSRGRAAAQGAAKLASSLVTTVWSVLEDVVIAPALQQYISAGDARATR
ncbi:hypothetical protein PLESTF_001381400 [Pleodorina starrii]|nr:hypothetical protein PLESTF_001381400 [Pleodorina starrii]